MSSLPLSPFDVALIGAGSVGTGVAALLSRARQRIVGVASRTTASAERASKLLDVPVFDTDRVPHADVYLIGTGSDALEQVAGELAASRDLGGSVVVHFAGAFGTSPLEKARAAGAHVGALHPVQACPDIDAATRNLPRSVWGATTSPGAEEWARGFVALLDGETVMIGEQDRPIWHAAAVVTSNGIAALLAGGESILEAIGVERPEAVLGPLARGTITNAALGGGGGATLTGPVVRGEDDVVHKHIAALTAEHADLAETYRAVSRLIARAAARSGRVEKDRYDAVVAAIEAGP